MFGRLGKRYRGFSEHIELILQSSREDRIRLTRLFAEADGFAQGDLRLLRRRPFKMTALIVGMGTTSGLQLLHQRSDDSIIGCANYVGFTTETLRLCFRPRVYEWYPGCMSCHDNSAARAP